MTEPARILIVDDDPATLDALGGILELEGYAVERARDGSEALARLAGSAAPRLILLDLRMPVMDGWQFLAERAKDPATARVPVVLLSGMSFIPNAPGVVDFLTKPIDPTRLLDTVERICGSGARAKARRRSESQT